MIRARGTKAREQALALLAGDLTPAMAQLNRRVLGDLAAGLAAWLDTHGGWNEAAQAEQVSAFLREEVRRLTERAGALRSQFEEFERRYADATSARERRDHILAFAAELGSSRRALRRDARAVERWFDREALAERYTRRIGECERRLAFVLDRLGHATADTACASPHDPDRGLRALESLVMPLLLEEHDTRIRVAGIRAIGDALASRASPERAPQLNVETVQFIYRAALDQRQDTWVQCEALRILALVRPEQFMSVLDRRLRHPGEGDDLFVRARALGAAATVTRETHKREALLTLALDDPAPHVRRTLAGLLAIPTLGCLELLDRLGEDTASAVRAQACLSLVERAVAGADPAAIAERLALWLEQGGDASVCRVAIEASAQAHARLRAISEDTAEAWHTTLVPALERTHEQATPLALRRYAGWALEAMWCERCPAARALRDSLQRLLDRGAHGRWIRLPRAVVDDTDLRTVGRVLSLLAYAGHGIELAGWPRRARIRVGTPRRFRWWRWLHELRTPSTDKRQGYRHTVGRHYHGALVAPSARMCELAATGVPGESILDPEEQGWRPYLPMPDHALAALDNTLGQAPLLVFTTEGETEVTPPRGLWAKLTARWQLSRRYARLASQREACASDASGVDTYVAELERIGFRVRIRAHAQRRLDPAVRRYFPALLPLPLGAWVERFRDYWVTPFENTLVQLLGFAGVIGAFFFLRHAYNNVRIHRARKAIPLVIGGWGTRGKSGTERLKAALINALGNEVACKSTGCEANLLLGRAHAPLSELFLFRPYDKATIWEQAEVLLTAEGVGVDALLWECMGLNPRYVEILQRQWMRDDLATITNAYADHEDLQGPAGVDVAEAIASFVPHNARLLTSEEWMLPVFATETRRRNTTLVGVTARQSMLLTDDVLARFPYDEHPSNVALVLALGRELGVPEDFAVKEMADRVVPDLGVLKTYPAADLAGRRLIFINGMSANERHATLGNWQRMGFDRRDPASEPGIWQCSIVNNRADRVTRSRIFAQLLVDELSADRHLLIGSNLHGLKSYIHEAWQQAARRRDPWAGERTGSPAERFRAEAERLRVPTEESVVEARVGAMLDGILAPAAAKGLRAHWRDPDALAAGLREQGREDVAADAATFTRHWHDEHARFIELVGQLETAAGPDPALRARCEAALWAWFQARLVVIDDLHASGSQICQRLARATPPGLTAIAMGLQNIKGTGLDFVYCWQDWAQCHALLQRLESRKPQELAEGLRALARFEALNALCVESVEAHVQRLHNARASQSEIMQAELNIVEDNLSRARRALAGETTGSGGRLLAGLSNMIEAVLDAGDAIRRRKQAERIYRDLVGERIAAARAARELKALAQRQKGGWLARRMLHWRDRLRAHLTASTDRSER